jgi:hypothetical protein
VQRLSSISNGVPIQEISDRIDRKSTHVTETVYRHVMLPDWPYHATCSEAATRLLGGLMVIAWRHDMVGQVPGQGVVLTSRPSLTLSALRQSVAAVAPERLPEMFTKMQEAFVQAGEHGSVTPIHMFHREWAVIVEIERHPETAQRLHAAEQALMSDDPQVRDAAIREASEIVRAAHRSVADVPGPVHAL